MREFICIETFGGTCKITWNPNAVQLRLEWANSGEKNEDGSVSFDGKEALKVLSFFRSL